MNKKYFGEMNEEHRILIQRHRAAKKECYKTASHYDFMAILGNHYVKVLKFIEKYPFRAEEIASQALQLSETECQWMSKRLGEDLSKYGIEMNNIEDLDFRME